ncbi:hypothetical protein GF362_01475 [Candidatus Dojkabacteria bacterium]|nr:hypothetical protein [Candidatus Dojkabacteria bacterium]
MLEKEIPTTLQRIAENNIRTLQAYNIDITDVEKNREKSFDANQRYFLMKLTGRMLEHLDDNDYRSYFESIDENNCEKTEYISELTEDGNIALLLVKPDMYHIYDSFREFLEDNGFQILYEADKILDIETYEKIYHEKIYGENFCEDFREIPKSIVRKLCPQRIMLLTESPSRLMVFTDPQNRYKDSNLPDGFSKDFKGRQGIQDNATMRGSIIYQEAKRLGFNTLENPILANALDPLHVYRNLIEDPKSPLDKHLPMEDRLLQYTGAGVHASKNNEIRGDLGALCTEDELQEILQNKKFLQDLNQKYRN